MIRSLPQAVLVALVTCSAFIVTVPTPWAGAHSARQSSAARQFRVHVLVASLPVAADPYRTAVTVFTLRGARCSAKVVYTNGRTPASFNGATQWVGSSGMARWTWHEQGDAPGGTVTVACIYQSVRVIAVAPFTIVPGKASTLVNSL